MTRATPKPNPQDAQACWGCWGWDDGITWGQVWKDDDGKPQWADVICFRCKGTGKEPKDA